jgi:RimJ/RimL family protein N-acetyltransferase
MGFPRRNPLQRLTNVSLEQPEGRPQQPPFRWVPIRALSERHRPRIRAHLVALGQADRYLRFGYAATDNQIGTYVDRIDFARDEVFGIFNRHLDLVAVAHLAYLDEGTAEFGVSALPHARGRGYGSRLFDHAVLHARNRHIDKLVMHALTENTAMLNIARRAGARVEQSGPEAQAHLQLSPDDLASQAEELVQDQAAELDYQLKVQAKRADDLIDTIAEVKSRLGGKRIASE